MSGTGLVLQEIAIIAERLAPIVWKADFVHEVEVYELAKQLRAALIDMEVSAIANAKDAA